MIVKRVDPLSLAKVAGLMYVVVGFLLGCFFALLSLAGGAASEQPGGALFGVLFGVGAVIFLPVLYGGFGFVVILLMAMLYNLIARLVGGIEIQWEGMPPNSGQGPA